ncbi:MAG: iron-sulfur cluster assembly accessory protein [Cohaesibacteraceae bacterium]|nr:iron-sulfur cluster assembly accessory protein [Cohaesibacteraceae bacterium]PCH80121.1 MAG: iron-sulfur cluster assembly accessory protein [Hyphomicrobiales bacterium]
MTSVETVTITERATARISKILSGEKPGMILRISVSGGGCSGFQYNYDIEPETNRQDDDLVLASEGSTVFIDPMSVEYMEGSQIDFVNDLMGQSFQITNPQAQSSCGCGTSFSL